MYICICNAVSDRQILDAVNAGVTRFDELVAELGVATGCGACEQAARRALADQVHRLGLELSFPTAA
jgi:bacterioferritin-associated ferredoxin